MWTNVFKIGGLQQITWFQFLPSESELNPPLDKSVRAEQKDAATYLVLSSHLQLQKEGFLSTWTNSFVGPWDPSQGAHNPDEKVKLWLFLPGFHSSVVETAQAAVSRLKVVAFGRWLAPGDSEEVAVALSQALRNCIERSLIDHSYMRFGDVFSKYCPSQSKDCFRRVQPTVEFVFAATEEAIFAHVVISAKNVRPLASGDVERALRNSCSNSSYRLPVILSPHGMRGKITGFCSNDLVKQVYFSSGKCKTSRGCVGLPCYGGQSSNFQIRGQNGYVEVSFGCSRSMSYNSRQLHSNSKNSSKHHLSNTTVGGRGDPKGLIDDVVCEKTLIYPAEAVLVPVLQIPFARSSLKRAGDFDFSGGSRCETNRFSAQNGYDSSSNSNTSSISSISSTSSESDHKITSTVGDLEADADSLTCRQSGLSSSDRSKLASKRPRTGVAEPFDQVGAATNSTELNDSVINGIPYEQIGSYLDWDDDDRVISMDIQALLSEFGDFGDFFENDALPFGEPPGTAESQALAFHQDGSVADTSPVGVTDASDQMLLPAAFAYFDNFNPTPMECVNQNQEVAVSTVTSGLHNKSLTSTGEYDHLMKAEAMMTFAPEYGAVETAYSETSSSLVKNPYFPKSHNINRSSSSMNSYVYGATPPSSPHFDGQSEKAIVSLDPKKLVGMNDGRAILLSRKCYTQVGGRKEKPEKKSAASCASSITKEEAAQSQFSSYYSLKSINSTQGQTTGNALMAGSIFFSKRTVLATDVECIFFQAFLRRMRHALISSSGSIPVSLTKIAGNSILSQLPGEPGAMAVNLSPRYEAKKKESIPIRIKGDIDGGILDGHLSAPVGVWRTVGVPIVSKPVDSPKIEASPSLPISSFNEEGLLSYSQRQPLQELLDGMALLVQQATSFVDVALDSDRGDGPYGWLALQELWSRELSCGPYMAHAGCGGTLASSHSLDTAGVELVDPLSAEIFPSSVIGLLHSDVKTALKSAFSILDGPLSISDWCKGRTQSGIEGVTADGSSADSALSECRDSSSTVTMSVAEPMSPCQSSAGASSGHKVSNAVDGGRPDEASQRKLTQEISGSELLRPTLSVLPLPAILVGYQDDWLKTSAGALQHWEKAPLEPYALQKHIAYNVICPDIDPLTSAASDFFMQLGTVYEACRLGTHSPQIVGNQAEVESGKLSSSGFVLLDCPQSMKIESSNASLLGSLSDYFLSLSNGWDMTSYLKSLSKALKGLKLSSWLSTNQKEGTSSHCMVIYVVCPFPEPMAILRTIVESSVAVGSSTMQSDRDRRSVLYTQVGRVLSSSAAVDEASLSHIPVLSGFSTPKLVLQIVTVDSIFRITNPTLNELVILKETAFTVYNKARRISRGSSTDATQSSSLARSSPTLQQMGSIPGIWKDCVGSRITGPALPREGDIDASLRSGTWDNSWQATRSGGLSCDPNRNGDFFLQDESRYMFEPLFILAEPGSVEPGISPNFSGNMITETSKVLSDDTGGGFMHGANSVGGVDSASSQLDQSVLESFGSGFQKSVPSLHCCYGWTEDWRWLVCIWTDARGELLDSHIFPFGGISSRQDTKGLQCLFIQVLQQGCQILQACSSPDAGATKPRDFVITRIGNFYELEYQEWQKAIDSFGVSEVKKWPLQLRQLVHASMPASSNGTPLQQQEMSLIPERTLPLPTSSLYGSHSKASTFMKSGLGQTAGRKQAMGGQTQADTTRSLLQWVHSISFAAISIDHSLQLVFSAESPSSGGASVGPSGYLEGFTPAKSLGSTSASYTIIPSPRMRFLDPSPLQLPTCLTAESPPLAHLLDSKGSTIPLTTGFVVSKAVPSMRKDQRMNMKEEWPSVLSVRLIDYYGSSNITQEKIAQGVLKQGGRNVSSEARDLDIESHLILESIAGELHALSWMTVSPAYLDRRTALPSHCDMVLRLTRLLQFADKELSHHPDISQV